MYLKSAAFVAEEGAWQILLCRSARNASLFFSILPGQTLAPKSQQFELGITLLLLDGS
jgi:hypothetical protein